MSKAQTKIANNWVNFLQSFNNKQAFFGLLLGSSTEFYLFLIRKNPSKSNILYILYILYIL